MYIKFTKEAAANERVYHKDDTALFQDELGQKLVDGGFAAYYDPGESLVLVDAPAAEGLEGANVAPKPVTVDSKHVVVDSKGVAKDAPKPEPEKAKK